MANQTVNNVTVQIRRDTAQAWQVANPILKEGELGFETDTGKSKCGDGTTTWNNLGYLYALPSHEHTTEDIVPMATKTYTDLYASPNNFAGGSFYFAKVIPDDYYLPWKAVYRVTVTVPNYVNYSGVYTIEMCGCQSSFICCKAHNNFFSTSYRPIYNHVLYRATQVGSSAYGHLLGERIYSATNGNKTGYKRTFVVELLSQENCTVTLFDTAVKYADANGTGETNYEGYTEFNGTAIGTKITGDANDNTLPNIMYYYNTAYFRGAVVAESLAVGDSTGYIQAVAGASFDISYPILWMTGAVAAGGTNYANCFIQHYDRNLANVKSTFSGRKWEMVYLVVTLSGKTATIDSEVITQDLPTTEDGKIYIALGRMGNQTTGQNYFLFQLMHPMYYYKDGAIREYSYIPSEYVKDTDLSTVATSGSYNDLSNKPTIPTVPTNVSSFTNDAGYLTSVSWNDVGSKPTFATVATSGSYNDLTDKPTIPSVYTLPTASSSTLGGVKVGSNLSIDANGVLSSYNGLPVGYEYFTMNPNVPQGSLPLFGGEYSRATYADLWAWVQTQTGYCKTEADWQTLATSNNGNVPYYSSGDGSTTFRVPSLKCWIKGANGTVTEVGSYKAAGLPNITGWFMNEFVYSSNVGEHGSLITATPSSYGSGKATGTSYGYSHVDIDASKSSSIYGNSTTVQPESIVGMWLVKAYGTVEDTGTIDEQQYIDDRIAALPTSLATTFLPLAGGTMSGSIELSGDWAHIGSTANTSMIIQHNKLTQGLELWGGYSSVTGACLILRGASNDDGKFYLGASQKTSDSDSSHSRVLLAGNPNGSLTWNSKEVERVNASGSNTNGDYIRYENGIQICWGGFANVSVPRTITYPVAFSGSPSVGIDRGTMICGNWSSTGCNIGMVAGGTSTGQYLKWIAIGKWK